MLKNLPELGLMLRMEEELPRLVRELHGGTGSGLFAEEEQQTWQRAESRLRGALTEFAQEARATYRSRLFAQDALQGLRLIDLARERFDVVVMNPPFGGLSTGVKPKLAKDYPRSKNDLLAIFVERGLELLNSYGYLGAITSRACLFLTSYRGWREGVVFSESTPDVIADFGLGVMDDAVVEAAACVLRKTS